MLRSFKSMSQRSALLLSLVAITAVALFEIIAGLVSNVMVVLVDGIHATLDALLTLILLLMLTWSMKPRDQEHTYGHGKIETIAGLIGGILLSLIAILIIRESIIRIIEGEHVIPNEVAFYAVITAIIVALFRLLILKGNIHDSKSIKTGFYDALSDLGSSIVALLGLILASYSIYIADGLASIVLALMIVFLSSRLAYTSALELTDAIDPMLVVKARDAVLSVDGVKACKDIRMRRVGKDILADVTVVLSNDITFNRAHMISSEVEHAVMSKTNASSVMVHFEPEQDAKIERIIEETVLSIKGVRNIHNLLISKSNSSIIVSMHIQVDKDLTLSEAHSIADRVEDAVKSRIKAYNLNVKNVTVHLEPYISMLQDIVEINDIKMLEDVVKSIAYEEGIRHISKVNAYRCNNTLMLDIYCKLDSKMSVERAHEMVSRIESKIRERLNALVTIHYEPMD